MAPERHGWVLTPAFLLVFAAGSFCGFRIWQRWAPWAVAETIPGGIPNDDRPGPVIVWDEEKQTVYFPDNDRLYRIPEGGPTTIHGATPTGCCLSCDGVDQSRYWDIDNNRYVPAPGILGNEWELSADGTRIHVCLNDWNVPRIYQVRSLDGKVLHQVLLPAMAPPDVTDRYLPPAISEDGRFVVEELFPPLPGAAVRIHEMAGGSTWEFGPEYCDLFDGRIVLLNRASPTPTNSEQSTLSAVELHTGRELWATPVPGGVRQVRPLDEHRILVLTVDQRVLLFDGTRGELRFELEGAWESWRTGERFRKLPNRRPLLAAHSLWDLKTGRKFPVERPSRGTMDVFPDGRRILIADEESRPIIVDLETGAVLFTFDPGPNGSRVAHAAGDRVLMEVSSTEVQIWTRKHPEGWIGHFVRPETHGALFCIAALLILRALRQRPGRSNQISPL